MGPKFHVEASSAAFLFCCLGYIKGYERNMEVKQRWSFSWVTCLRLKLPSELLIFCRCRGKSRISIISRKRWIILATQVCDIFMIWGKENRNRLMLALHSITKKYLSNAAILSSPLIWKQGCAVCFINVVSSTFLLSSTGSNIFAPQFLHPLIPLDRKVFCKQLIL